MCTLGAVWAELWDSSVWGGGAGGQLTDGIHGNTVTGLSVTTNGPNLPAFVDGVLGVRDIRQGIPPSGYASGNIVVDSMLGGAGLCIHVGGRLGHYGVT